MASGTPQLLAELREDHRNMSVVLDLLQDCVEIAAAGQDPDFELIDDIMHYMTVYPDAVHHPKEDVVYAELLSHKPALRETLDDVPEDHRQIAELGLRLREDVEAIVAGAAVRREQFVDDAGRYVDRLRGHIQWEEKELFDYVDEMIEDSPIDVTAVPHMDDPVFDIEIESGFRRLVAALGTVSP